MTDAEPTGASCSDDSAKPSRSRILHTLNTIGDPCSVANGTPLGLVDMGVVGDVTISNDGAVTVPLRLTSPSCYMVGYFIEEIRARLSNQVKVADLQIRPDLGLDWTPEMMTDEGHERRRVSLSIRGLQPRVGMSVRDEASSDHAIPATATNGKPATAVTAPNE